MPNPAFAGAGGAAEPWAEVRACDQVVRYRRSGVGRATLVLLRSPDCTEAPWPDLVEALANRFRLILPEPPAAEADLACWLGAFLEGLGVPNVSVLAADRFCIPVLEVALLAGDQIARVVLIPAGRAPRPAGSGALETAMRQGPVPLLVIRAGQPAAEVVPLVTDFFDASGTPAAA